MTKDRLIEPHYEQSVYRIKSSQSKYILAIQDQMRLNYTHHLAKHDLGRIGKTGKTTQYGLIQHSVLCVDDRNEPLGLIDLSFFDLSRVLRCGENNILMALLSHKIPFSERVFCVIAIDNIG